MSFVRFLLPQICFSLASVIFASCFQPVAQADPTYAFTGVVTLPGNNACNGQCVETINVSFDFQWDPVSQQFPTFNFGTVSNFVVAPNGPLDFTTGGNGVDQFPFWAIVDGQQDEVDLLNASAFAFVGVDIAPVFIASVYSCSSATCVTDFAPNGFCEIYSCPVTSSFSESILPVQTSEPPVLLLVTVGLFAFLTKALRGRVLCVCRVAGAYASPNQRFFREKFARGSLLVRRGWPIEAIGD
jgi:hypothetical protein